MEAVLREAPGNGDGGELGDQHVFHPINKTNKQKIIQAMD